MTWKGRLTRGTSLRVPSSLYLPGQTSSVLVASIFAIRFSPPSAQRVVIEGERGCVAYRVLDANDNGPGYLREWKRNPLSSAARLPGDDSFGVAKEAQITLFADRCFRRLCDPEFFSLYPRDHLIEVAASLFDPLGSVRKGHDRLVLPFFRRPVEHQPVHPLVVAPLQDVGVG